MLSLKFKEHNFVSQIFFTPSPFQSENWIPGIVKRDTHFAHEAHHIAWWATKQATFSNWEFCGFLVLLLMINIMILIALGITLAMIACWLWLTSWVQLRQLYTCLRSLILAIPTICVHAAEAHRNLYQSYSCQTRSSWLNCALRGDEAVYWAIIGQQWLVLADTESIWGGTSWQLMWLGQ